MSKLSPTRRSLAYLREHGWTCEVAEYWNSFANCRKDLFGFIDIVAIQPGTLRGVLAVQACAQSSQAARVTKIRELPVSHIWLEAGNRIIVMGWRKDGSVRLLECLRGDGDVVIESLRS